MRKNLFISIGCLFLLLILTFTSFAQSLEVSVEDTTFTKEEFEKALEESIQSDNSKVEEEKIIKENNEIVDSNEEDASSQIDNEQDSSTQQTVSPDEVIKIEPSQELLPGSTGTETLPTNSEDQDSPQQNTNMDEGQDSGNSQEASSGQNQQSGSSNDIVNYDKRYAVIIIGWHEGLNSYEAEDIVHYNYYRNDAIDFYNTFTNANGDGHDFDEVYVLFSTVDRYEDEFANDPEKYRPLPFGSSLRKSNKANMIFTFQQLRSKMDDDDLLVVSLVDHGIDLGWFENYRAGIKPPSLNYNLPDNNPGGHDTKFNDGSNTTVFDIEFGAYAANIDAQRIIFFLQPCFAGGFIKELKGQNRVILAASRERQIAVADFYGGIESNMKRNDNEDALSMAQIYKTVAQKVDADIGPGPGHGGQYEENLGFQHVLIDDNGDGIGSHYTEPGYNPTSPGMDGYIASKIYNFEYEDWSTEDDQDDTESIRISAPSSVYETNQFEVQVLDSDNNPIKADVTFNSQTIQTSAWNAYKAIFFAPDVTQDKGFNIQAVGVENNLYTDFTIIVKDQYDEDESNQFQLYVECVDEIDEWQTFTARLENSTTGEGVRGLIRFNGCRGLVHTKTKWATSLTDYTVSFTTKDVDFDTNFQIDGWVEYGELDVYKPFHKNVTVKARFLDLEYSSDIVNNEIEEGETFSVRLQDENGVGVRGFVKFEGAKWIKTRLATQITDFTVTYKAKNVYDSEDFEITGYVPLLFGEKACYKDFEDIITITDGSGGNNGNGGNGNNNNDGGSGSGDNNGDDNGGNNGNGDQGDGDSGDGDQGDGDDGDQGDQGGDDIPTGSIWGKVWEKESLFGKDPVEGAIVSISGYGSDTTDDDGVYEIDGLPKYQWYTVVCEWNNEEKTANVYLGVLNSKRQDFTFWV